jgi:hypothetical protein
LTIGNFAGEEEIVTNIASSGGLVLLSVIFISVIASTANGETDWTKGFHVCVGDVCPTNFDARVGCSFADKHPSDTIEAFVRDLCTIQHNFNSYKFENEGVGPGGKCGVVEGVGRCIP